MKIITATGAKRQQNQVSVNLRINSLRDALRKSQLTEETLNLLAFFIEETQDGAVKKWLLEFQRIFNAFNNPAVGIEGGAK